MKEEKTTIGTTESHKTIEVEQCSQGVSLGCLYRERSSWGAALTPAQARDLADKLREIADRYPV